MDHNQHFEKNTLDWRDLTVFITAFCDIVSSMMDVHKAISTNRDGGWGQDDITCSCVRVQSDCIPEHHV